MWSNTQFWDELAIQSYRTILKKSPKNPLVHKNLGLAYMRMNRLNKAARSFQRAIKNNKAYVEAYYHLGTCYERLGKKVEAIRAFNNYNKHIKKGQINDSSVVSQIIKKLKN